MRIDQLRFLVSVAETGSITQSAECLHISQQGLSQSIKSLETKLGVILLNRDVNRISLTEEGKITVEKAKDILSKYDELLIELEPSIRIKNDSNQKLIIYATPLLSKTLLQKALIVFSKKCPQVNLCIIEENPYKILDDIRSTENAIGLISLRRYIIDSSKEFKNPDFDFENLGECRVFASISKTSPLATKGSVTIDELIKKPIVAYNAEQHIKTIYDLFRKVGKPNLKVITANWELYESTITNGIAIGVSNCLFGGSHNNLQYVNVPIEESSNFNLIIGIATFRKQPLTPFAKYFMRILKRISAKEYPDDSNTKTL